MATKDNSNWISLSDMMTGLMLIFLLIAILVTMQVVNQQRAQQQIVTDYKNTKEEIYNDLKEAFQSKEDDWGIEITRDLVVKFKNPDLLFGVDESTLKNEYEVILDQFIPLYLGIVNKSEYEDGIKEVRIEGHTADYSPAHPTYMSTISLSQNRSNSVLEHILGNRYFNELSAGDRDKLRFWFSANGLGNGRTLDEAGEFTYETHDNVSPNSRRVEFRILTTSEKLIDEIINRYSSF